MRRCTALTILLVAVLAGPAPARSIQVRIDDQALTFDQPPVLQQDRVLVPLRGIFEALGATVDFDRRTRTVRAGKNRREVRLAIGSRVARVGAKRVTLDVPAQILRGRTLVPLRFVAEALGAEVKWVGPELLVAISTRGATEAGGSEPSEPVQPRPVVTEAGSFNPAVDLRRIRVGNQAGVLKVLDRQLKQEVYFRTLDDRTTAPITDEQREKVLAALGIDPDALNEAALSVMNGYQSLPKKQALALVGFIGSAPGSALSEAFRLRMRSFLASKMLGEGTVVLRRQALLSLALMEGTDASTVSKVLEFYETSDNLWETFPVQMFFEYHAADIRRLPDIERIRSRVAAVESLYTPYLLGYLAEGGMVARGERRFPVTGF